MNSIRMQEFHNCISKEAANQKNQELSSTCINNVQMYRYHNSVIKNEQ